MTQRIEKTLALPDGLELAYTEQGDRGGPALLMLHGLTDSSVSFSRMTPHLPEGLRAIAITLRGHGESSKPVSSYRSEELASDVARAMDALALERATVVGHSLGAFVATRMALDFSERVSGLVLLGGFRTVSGNPAAEELFRDHFAALQDPVPRELARAFQESTIQKPVPPAFLEQVIDESLKVPAYVWRTALRALLDQDLSAQIDRIRAKALVVWGDRDAFIPYEEQTELAAALKAELHVLRGIGHALHWEEPETVARLIARFVQGAQSVAA